MLGNLVGVLFDGLAYGSLLFIISIGLSVTMGLMNFVNLAHGAFAMLGGYACVLLMTRAGLPFLATLPVAFVVAAAAGIVLERTLYQRLYKAAHLDQVMFSIGLVFMAVAATTYFFGPSQQPMRLPEYLRGQVRVLGLDVGTYRLFLIAVVGTLNPSSGDVSVFLPLEQALVARLAPEVLAGEPPTPRSDKPASNAVATREAPARVRWDAASFAVLSRSMDSGVPR